MTNTNALAVTEQKVAKIRAEIALSDALVEKVLVPGIDYGLHPGTSSHALKDPGANTIINAFGCYPRSKVLYRQADEERISYVIDVELVSRDDGLIKATGTGAASTKETKYGYRWVTDPESFGWDRGALKKRTRDNRDQFRIINPEWSELENTILKMARKRAEVDAAMGLPGVSRFMAKLNTGQLKAPGTGPPSENWSGFWTRTKAIGLSELEVHTILGVSSVTEWKASGRTLSDAIRVIAEYQANKAKSEEG